jgi:hypothetical protein
VVETSRLEKRVKNSNANENKQLIVPMTCCISACKVKSRLSQFTGHKETAEK